MAVVSQLREVLGRKQAQAEDAPVAITAAPDNKNDHELGDIADEKPVNDLPSEAVQHGVKLAQALTLTWSKNSLIAIFIL